MGDVKAWNEAKRYFRRDALRESFEDSFRDQEETTGLPLRIRQVLDSLGPTDDSESLDRIVAIKVMSPHLASSGSDRKRFAREAKAAAAVLHPNVIAIHGVASDDVCPYLVMPYVRGTSLQKRIDSQGPLPLKDTLRIGAQIAAE